jgi:hypothetical protein
MSMLFFQTSIYMSMLFFQTSIYLRLSGITKLRVAVIAALVADLITSNPPVAVGASRGRHPLGQRHLEGSGRARRVEQQVMRPFGA